MTADSETATRSDAVRLLPGALTPKRVVGAVVLLQALWLAILAGRGWYSQADLSNLAQAERGNLDWKYLSDSLGGHFAIFGRLEFWLLHRMAPMNYPATVAVRLVLQAVSTWLLARLLVRLVGERPLVLLTVALYAFSPLIAPTFVYLTPGLVTGIGQVFTILALDAHVRHSRNRSLATAAETGGWLLLATLNNDQTAIISLLLPILTLGFLTAGTFVDRLRHAVSDWRAWLLKAVPLAVYLIVYLSAGYGQDIAAPSLGDQLALCREFLLRLVAPAFIGGPWHWYAGPTTYAAFAATTDLEVVLALLAVAVAVAVGLQRTGRISLVAWTLPLITAVAGILLVGAGRYGPYGATLSVTPRYAFIVAVPLALALVLALCPLRDQARSARAPAERVAASDSGMASPSSSRRTPDSRTVVLLVLTVAVTVGGAVSNAEYASHWWRNPAHSYVTTLVASVRAAGPSVGIYDTPIRGDVVTSIEPAHHISDLLSLEGVSANFSGRSANPLIATNDGRLVRAAFVPVATAAGPQQTNCGTFLHGAQRLVVPLSAPVRTGEWFLYADAFQSTSSTISVQIEAADGTLHAPVTGSTQHLGSLAALRLRLPSTAPAKIILTSKDSSTSLCMVRLMIGAPFPAGG